MGEGVPPRSAEDPVVPVLRVEQMAAMDTIGIFPTDRTMTLRTERLTVSGKLYSFLVGFGFFR